MYSKYTYIHFSQPIAYRYISIKTVFIDVTFSIKYDEISQYVYENGILENPGYHY